MRGTVVSDQTIFWHFPEAVDVGRHLFGVLWNPDDSTEDEALAIAEEIERQSDVEVGVGR